MSDEVMAQNKDLGNPDANVVEELSVDGSNVGLVITIGGTSFRNSNIAVGKECEATGLDGRSAKVRTNNTCYPLCVIDIFPMSCNI